MMQKMFTNSNQLSFHTEPIPVVVRLFISRLRISSMFYAKLYYQLPNLVQKFLFLISQTCFDHSITSWNHTRGQMEKVKTYEKKYKM